MSAVIVHLLTAGLFLMSHIYHEKLPRGEYSSALLMTFVSCTDPIWKPYLAGGLFARENV